MKIVELLCARVDETGAQMGHIHRKMARGPYFIISAWRGNYSVKQNRDRHAQLKQRLHNEFGSGSIDQEGGWEGRQVLECAQSSGALACWTARSPFRWRIKVVSQLKLVGLER